jgi:hypothetical protein
MAIRFLDDITSEGSSTFVENVSAHDFFAYTGNLMNSICAVSAVLHELVTDPERLSWTNTATIVSLKASNWDAAYSFAQKNSAAEINQDKATTFVINTSADIIATNDMVLKTPFIITDGGFF